MDCSTLPLKSYRAVSANYLCLHLHAKDWTLNHLKKLIKKIAMTMFLSFCSCWIRNCHMFTSVCSKSHKDCGYLPSPAEDVLISELY